MSEPIDRFTGTWRGLSNFALHPDGKSVEHCFQAAKDFRAAERIMAAATPGEAKFLGGPNGIAQLSPDWEEGRSRAVMRSCLFRKFAIPQFRDLLLSSGDRELVEGNYHHDMIWGRCLCDVHRGAGENRLGRLLMEVRRVLYEQWRLDHADEMVERIQF